MEIGTHDVDAKLLEQLSALGTNDKDELVNQLRALVGTNISVESCNFFLELAGWNLQRAVGAYFDFSFDSSPSISVDATTHDSNYNCASSGVTTSHPLRSPLLYDLRIWPSPSGSTGTAESFKVTVENSGCSPWHDGVYLRSESNPDVAKLSTKDRDANTLHWLPIGLEGRIPLPPVLPGQFVELDVKVDSPDPHQTEACIVSVTGALSFCLPNGDVFGETLYCTAIRNGNSQSWVFQRGVPEFVSTRDADTPMDEF